MLKIQLIIFKFFILFFISSSILKAELINPNNNIEPIEVIKIQLTGLQNNDLNYNDFGIKQTWNFAHPDNKKNTGPLENFTQMIKGNAYGVLINHLENTISLIKKNNDQAEFEVIILDQNKIYHKLFWQVEKYIEEGPLKDCWLTTVVTSPISLGSSI